MGFAGVLNYWFFFCPSWLGEHSARRHEKEKGRDVRRDMARSELPMLVLAVVAESPRHGYAIARAVQERSEDALRLREGALYPALRSLEADGLVIGEWETPESGPARRIYTITPAGRQALAARVEEWKQYSRGIGRVIGGLAHGNA